MKKTLILSLILATSMTLMSCNKAKNFESEKTLECNDYQGFKNESWYSTLVEEITKRDKIDTEGIKWIQMFSSQSNPGSTDEIINREGKIIESDMIKLCILNEKEILIMTRQRNDLNYIFSFNTDSKELKRANGRMIINETEEINTPEIKEGNILFKTTTYGENNMTWEKVFNYNQKDNSVYHAETCKIENNSRDCEMVEKK